MGAVLRRGSIPLDHAAFPGRWAQRMENSSFYVIKHGKIILHIENIVVCMV
ncbi:hypothetical protein LJB90_02265 [Eubacteriales bacterium OttesenSCG-928-G02]|nr:hypothetical protein [Eubacteriales bacterium OttesenSCG-928-G02]